MTLKEALDKYKGIGPGFNLLRHVLSIAIVLFHCRQVIYWRYSAQVLAAAGVTNPDAAADAAQYGPVHFALVDLSRPVFHALLGMFFALSGFLVAGSAVRTASVLKFFMNRALRILPALAVETLLSAFILGPLITILPLAAYFADPQFREYLGNMVGWIHFYLPGVYFYAPGVFANPLYKTVNGQLWTLPSELYCYATMAPFLATGLIRRPRFFLVAGLVGVIAMLGLFAYDPAHFNPKHQNFFAPWYLVVAFWFGAIFFLNADRVKLNVWIFALGVAAYWLVMMFNVATPLAGIFLTYCTVYIGFTRFPWWDRWVTADYSYGLFLYHYPIMQALMYLCGPHWQHVPLLWQFAMIVALCVPTTLAFAALSWRFVEKPALALRSVFARTKPVMIDDHSALPTYSRDPAVARD